MVTENTTLNRGYQEPAVGNTLEVDVGRLIAALRAIDDDVASALAAVVAKAGLASPAFTGTPTAPTAAPGTDSGQLATTAFVKAALAALVGLAPEALDTIEELAAASESNSDLIDLLEDAIALKADAAATTAALAGKADLTSVNTFTKIQKWAKGADVASAAALTLGDDGNYFDVTGTTAITSIATVGVGTVIKLHFSAALTLTHHAANLVLPYGVNIATTPGLELEFVEYAAGKWRCTSFMPPPVLYFRDQKTAGTDGGGASAGNQTRVFNTVVTNEISGAGLSSNVITLPAGTYDIEALSVVNNVGRHRIKLQVSGGGAVLAYGLDGLCAGQNQHNVSQLSARIVLAASTNIVVTQYCQLALANTGLGVALNNGEPEVYTEFFAQKVA